MTRPDSHNRSSTSSTSSCSRSGRSYYTAATSTASARQRPVALLLFLVTLGSCFLCAMFAKPLELSDFSVQDGDGKDFAMDQFKDVPAVLIVNVASKCGYTDSNYRELQTLRTRHSEDKLTIIAFPCNQFGGQEPAPWSEIADFVQREYGASFPVMGKVNVNGHQSHPIFAWLKAASGIPGDIPWNFSKFLVTCGDRVQRYSHEVSPMQIEEDIINAPDICSGDLFIGEL